MSLINSYIRKFPQNNNLAIYFLQQIHLLDICQRNNWRCIHNQRKLFLDAFHSHSVRSTIRIRTVFFITKILSVYVTQIRTTGGFFFIYLTTYHYITVCNNGDKKHVLTKLIARTRFSDSDYLFSEINVKLLFY